MLAQVIVDIVHEQVAHTFTYTIPQGLRVSVGQRVEVPFGPRRKEGVVVALTETCDVPPEKLKPIASTLEDYPAILPCLLKLAQRMAEEAHCPLAETLRLMLPAEMRGGRVRVKRQPVAVLTVPPERLDEAVAAQGRSQKRKTLLTLLRDGQPPPRRGAVAAGARPIGAAPPAGRGRAGRPDAGGGAPPPGRGRSAPRAGLVADAPRRRRRCP